MLDIIITVSLLAVLAAAVMLHVNEGFSDWVEEHVLEPIQNAIYNEEDDN